jgi:hypothetical protein
MLSDATSVFWSVARNEVPVGGSSIHGKSAEAAVRSLRVVMSPELPATERSC